MSSVANLFSDLVLSSTSLACKLNASCVCVVVVSKLVSLCLVEVLSWLVLGVVAFFFFFFFSFFFFVFQTLGLVGCCCCCWFPACALKIISLLSKKKKKCH